MYKHRLLEELEIKYESRFNMYPEYEVRCLCYCLELVLNYEKLTTHRAALYRNFTQNLQKILRSNMIVFKEHLDVIYVHEGWVIVKNNIDRLKKELYTKEKSGE